MATPLQAESVLSRPDFKLVASRGFTEWLAGEPLSLALTTYHVGGVIMLGTKRDGSASMHVAAFDRSMGCWTDGQTMWLVTERMVWRLANDLAQGQRDDAGYDRVFVPRVGYTVGEVDGHEISVDGDGRPIFVNTAFSCLATVDERTSFRPLWRPPFISRLAPEDRCHLSGLAMVEGRPKYVSMHARSDVADGWRDFRETGGLILDVDSGNIVAEGVSMPHSPRYHAGRLWLLNSGTGHLGFVDLKSGKFEPVTFLPGYARGLAFHGEYAFVGLSKPRREHAFQGLPLEKNLAERGAAPRCGLMVIELKSGAVLHWARIESAIEELFDVAALPGVVRPKVLSFTSKTYARQLSFVDAGKLERWTMAPSQAESGRTGDGPVKRSKSADDSPDMLAPRRTPGNTAKALNNLGLMQVEQGDLEEARQCFEQAVAMDPGHAGAQNNLGNVLRQLKLLEQAVESYRRAIQADPKYARAYVNLGQTLAELGRTPEAGGCFRRALNIEPDYVDAGLGLGMALKDQGKLVDARRCFEQVLALDSQSWAAYNGLGLVEKERDELDKALACYERALSINPSAAAALANKGSLLRDLNRLDEALAVYDCAIEIDPECVDAHHNRSMLRLMKGDYENGWREYEWRWKQSLRQERYADRPRWDGSPANGRTILLHSEQGLGDTLQFIRYAPLVAQKGAQVIVQCQAPLVALLASCPGISRVVDNETDAGPFDAHAPLLSLPLLFGTTLDTVPAQVPYLTVDRQLIADWSKRTASIAGFKIGIAWQGNPSYPEDRRRSILLAEFAPLARLPGVSLVSLQKGFGVEQIERLSSDFAVIELAGSGNVELDFANTAALMLNLDLVIACNSSLCHLAGGLGVPTWVALSLASDWRFLIDRDDSPWYPSMRLFRQTTLGDRRGVFQRMQAALQVNIRRRCGYWKNWPGVG